MPLKRRRVIVDPQSMLQDVRSLEALSDDLIYLWGLKEGRKDGRTGKGVTEEPPRDTEDNTQT